MLPDLLRKTAAREPDAVAFVDDDRRLTYAEWDWLSDRAAFSLAAEGLEPGDVVAQLLEPSIHYPIAYLGAAKIGCVTVGINPRLAQPEIDAILDHSLARALVTDRSEQHAPDVFAPQQLNRPGSAPPTHEAKPEDPVAIVYTSGTTGTPKGATYTNSALEAVRRIEGALDPVPRAVSLQAISMAHMQFMTKMGSFIERRNTAVIMNRWSARGALEMVERERITAFGGIPTQLALMMQEAEFDDFDLSSLQSVTLGGAPASPELIELIRARFAVPVIVRYSSTELALCTATRLGDPDDVVARTVGRPLPEVDLVIADAGPNGIGTVCARSPAMMRGYWRSEASGIDEHGYIRTGDLGRLRADGNLELVGRATDMYIRGGYNVYPVEVENALREHPSVAQCAVLGLPDELLGEKGVAVVVPVDAAAPPSREELIQYLASRVASYKLPDLIDFRANLPLNATFKVDKRALAEERKTKASNP